MHNQNITTNYSKKIKIILEKKYTFKEVFL